MSKLKTYRECQAIWGRHPKLSGMLVWLGITFTTFKRSL
jgi:hypothetical protein